MKCGTGSLIRLVPPLIALVAIVSTIINSPVIEEKNQEIRVPDVIAYYSASVLCEKNCKDAYNSEAVLEIQRPILHKYHVSNPGNDILTFLYPPSALFFFLPLRYLNFEQAYDVLLAFNVLLTVALLFQLKRMSAHWHGWHFSAFSTLIVVSPAWYQLVLAGQISLLLIFLLLLFFDAFIHVTAKRPSHVVMPLAAVSWFKPHLIFYHIGLLLALRKWKELAFFVLFSLSMIVGIWFCFGDILLGYVLMLFKAGE